MKKTFTEILLAMPLSDEDRNDLKHHTSSKSFKKGESIFLQGEHVGDVYSINSGLVKLSYNTASGKELIKSFLCEGDVVSSLACIQGEGPSTFSAICLEDVELERFPYTKLEYLIDTYPEMQKFALTLFRQLAFKKEKREHEFLCLSAPERYQSFLQQNPDLVERISQQELALYLGITPVALSRLKHRD